MQKQPDFTGLLTYSNSYSLVDKKYEITSLTMNKHTIIHAYKLDRGIVSHTHEPLKDKQVKSEFESISIIPQSDLIISGNFQFENCH